MSTREENAEADRQPNEGSEDYFLHAFTIQHPDGDRECMRCAIMLSDYCGREEKPRCMPSVGQVMDAERPF